MPALSQPGTKRSPSECAQLEASSAARCNFNLALELTIVPKPAVYARTCAYSASPNMPCWLVHPFVSTQPSEAAAQLPCAVPSLVKSVNPWLLATTVLVHT